MAYTSGNSGNRQGGKPQNVPQRMRNQNKHQKYSEKYGSNRPNPYTGYLPPGAHQGGIYHPDAIDRSKLSEIAQKSTGLTESISREREIMQPHHTETAASSHSAPVQASQTQASQAPQPHSAAPAPAAEPSAEPASVRSGENAQGNTQNEFKKIHKQREYSPNRKRNRPAAAAGFGTASATDAFSQRAGSSAASKASSGPIGEKRRRPFFDQDAQPIEPIRPRTVSSERPDTLSEPVKASEPAEEKAAVPPVSEPVNETPAPEKEIEKTEKPEEKAAGKTFDAVQDKAPADVPESSAKPEIRLSSDGKPMIAVPFVNDDGTTSTKWLEVVVPESSESAEDDSDSTVLAAAAVIPLPDEDDEEEEEEEEEDDGEELGAVVYDVSSFGLDDEDDEGDDEDGDDVDFSALSYAGSGDWYGDDDEEEEDEEEFDDDIEVVDDMSLDALIGVSYDETASDEDDDDDDDIDYDSIVYADADLFSEDDDEDEEEDESEEDEDDEDEEGDESPDDLEDDDEDEDIDDESSDDESSDDDDDDDDDSDTIVIGGDVEDEDEDESPDDLEDDDEDDEDDGFDDDEVEGIEGIDYDEFDEVDDEDDDSIDIGNDPEYDDVEEEEEEEEDNEDEDEDSSEDEDDDDIKIAPDPIRRTLSASAFTMRRNGDDEDEEDDIKIYDKSSASGDSLFVRQNHPEGSTAVFDIPKGVKLPSYIDDDEFLEQWLNESDDDMANISKKTKRKISTILGASTLVLALIGLGFILLTLFNSLQTCNAKPSRNNEYVDFVMPAVYTDIAPFETWEAINKDKLLDCCLVGAIDNADTPYPTDDNNRSLVPTSDVLASAKRLFGEAATIDIETLASSLAIEVNGYYYDDLNDVFHVEQSGFGDVEAEVIGSPKVKSDSVEFEVGYKSASAILEDSSDDDQSYFKTMQFILNKNEDGSYYIAKLRDVKKD